MNKCKSLLWLSFLFVLSASLFRVGPTSKAATEPTIYVDPTICYAEVGEHINVSVNIVDALNIYAWQTQMTFNNTVLECINATEGDFLATQPETDFYKAINNTEGYIGFGISCKGKLEGVDGYGTLGFVEFEVLAEGECVLNITHPLSYLIEIYPPPVPAGEEPLNEIDPNKENGLFFNLEAPPSAEFTYSPSTAEVNKTITFDASASYASPPLEIIRYEWDFGDDTNDTGVIVEHNYTKPGVYTVTLTVIDNATGTDLVHTMFDTTTTMPDIWYELHSQTKKVISLLHEHDIAITSVVASKETVTVGESVYIDVKVVNKGLVTEDFNVTAYYGETAIETKQVTGLSKGDNETLAFSWDTTEVPEGTYTISAEANVDGEDNPDDNVFVDGTVMVEAIGEFPTMLVVVAVVVVVAVGGVVAFLYMRRKRTPAT